MTDVKPFVSHDSSPPKERTVAVLLVASAMAEPFERRAPGMLDPLGATNLFDRALQCLEGVQEATERAVWAEDTALLERFEAERHPGIRLLGAPPDRCLRRGAPDALRSTHALVVDGRHPLLRPNTLDEAIRLLRLRQDIEAICSCVRVRGALYHLDGAPVGGEANGTRAMLLVSQAFSLVPAETISLGRALTQPAYAFEIGHTEGFRVDTAFTQELAEALLQARQSSRPD